MENNRRRLSWARGPERTPADEAMLLADWRWHKAYVFKLDTLLAIPRFAITTNFVNEAVFSFFSSARRQQLLLLANTRSGRAYLLRNRWRDAHYSQCKSVSLAGSWIPHEQPVIQQKCTSPVYSLFFLTLIINDKKRILGFVSSFQFLQNSIKFF